MVRSIFKHPLSPDEMVLRRNLAANILDGGFYALAMALVSQQTVLPVFVRRMGGSNIHVALIPVLWTFGFNFPGIFIAGRVQHFVFKRHVFLKTAFFQRLTWIILGFFSYLLIERVPPGAALLIFFILFTLAAVSGSINLPVWFDLMAKLTPRELRGRLFAARNILGGLLGVVGGAIVEQILSTVRYPLNFSLIFLIAVAAMMISYAFLLRLKEETADTPRVAVKMDEYLRSLPGILRTNRKFRNFLISDALLIAATMGGAFYAVDAIEKFSLPDSIAGVFTIVIMSTTILGNMVFGVVGDRYGHKVNLVWSGVCTAAASVAAIAAPSVGWYLVSFAGAALTVSLSGISRLSLVAELCSPAERLTYVALTNMVTSPFVLFGLLGGWIANRFGYDAVFVVTAALAAASAAWLGSKVKEPRKESASVIAERLSMDPVNQRVRAHG